MESEVVLRASVMQFVTDLNTYASRAPCEHQQTGLPCELNTSNIHGSNVSDENFPTVENFGPIGWISFP